MNSEKILSVLSSTPTRAIDIARMCGVQRASDVNPTLYTLEKDGAVVSVKVGNIPMWRKRGFQDEVVSTFALWVNNPQNLDLAVEFLKSRGVDLTK